MERGTVDNGASFFMKECQIYKSTYLFLFMMNSSY